MTQNKGGTRHHSFLVIPHYGHPLGTDTLVSLNSTRLTDTFYGPCQCPYSRGFTVKPGSHMPPKYLRHSRRYCLQYLSDVWGHNAAGNKKHRWSLPPACLRSWTRVNFAGMPVVKTGMTNVASHFCSHIGTASQAVPAPMSQVQRRHMRTSRLNRTCGDIAVLMCEQNPYPV